MSMRDWISRLSQRCGYGDLINAAPVEELSTRLRSLLMD